jgi:hypothetical protein
VWIEATGLAEWIRVSALGYPMMIMFHSLGLAIMVGMSVVLSLRVVGAFPGIPYSSLPGFLKVAWIGFIINTISGFSLFAAQATSYLTNVPFIIKIIFVFIGAILVGWLQGLIKSGADSWSAGASPLAKAVAVVTIVVWAVAMVTGRLIAYL